MTTNPPTTLEQRACFIPLTKGKFALVDAEDFEWLSKRRWTYNKSRSTGYAYSAVYSDITGTTTGKIIMHRLIMNVPSNMQIDHINGDGLDNRRANLRICTGAQNSRNLRKLRGTSRYKGVSFYKATNKWVAQIGHSGKKYRLGYFNNEIDAAEAYNAAAKEKFGEFARLNSLPLSGEQGDGNE